jgi:hypothetical protein
MKPFDYYCTPSHKFISQENEDRFKESLLQGDPELSSEDIKYLTSQWVLMKDEVSKKELRLLESEFWRDLWEELGITDPNQQEELILKVVEHDRYLQDEIFYSEKDYREIYEEIKKEEK